MAGVKCGHLTAEPCNVAFCKHGDRTISLKAYNRLKTARRYPDESFSEVVLRDTWPEDTVTAGALLEQLAFQAHASRAGGTGSPGSVEECKPAAGGQVDRPLILETTFLIDLEREHHRGAPGPAVTFLEANRDARLYLPFIVAGELAAGLSMRDRARWEAFLAPFHVLSSTADVSWQYGRAYRHLHVTGATIGANELWIAATALAYGMPVVTRNVDQFRRVPGSTWSSTEPSAEPMPAKDQVYDPPSAMTLIIAESTIHCGHPAREVEVTRRFGSRRANVGGVRSFARTSAAPRPC